MKHSIAIVTSLALVLLAFTQPAAARQVGKLPRIGILMVGSPSSYGKTVDWFRQGLRDLGYVEGKNFVAVNRWAMGKRERLAALAKDLIKDKVDVIVINGNSSIKAVLNVTRTVPIVVGSAGNLPKYVTSLARPGGNITGSTYDSRALGTKRLALLKDAFPGAQRVAYLFLRSDKNILGDLKRLETAANARGIKIQPLHVRIPGDIESAFASIVNGRADALFIRQSGPTIHHRKRLAALAITKKLPTMCEHASFARAGCLMTYTRDLRQMMRRAAVFVDKILKGAKPADLPVEVATRYNLVVNLKTAKALGITLPPSILLQATKVIE
jgi:putative ABC transport system substrate-binding protein